MAAPAAGGSILARFDTILAAAAPELAERVRVVAFDAETGRLYFAPDTPAAGTKLRWSAPKLITAANATVSGANVRSLHVLAPAHTKAGPAVSVAAAPQPAAPALPVQRRTDIAVRSRRTAKPCRRHGWPRASRRQWSGRTGRCASSAAGPSPSRPQCRMMHRLRWARPASSVAARLRRPRLPRCAGPEPRRPAIKEGRARTRRGSRGDVHTEARGSRCVPGLPC
ncbi:DciA family protein [Streptomyces sp. NBC_00144]|uniref:DciA family protein n=1 Tax=Streptomyces sp. NBC_00144 TaxID=2975665 RepID=UPI0032434FBE